jgi:hypothetical protein
MFFAELCTVTHFNTSKSSCLISCPGKAGSYKQPIIQQIAHGAISWGWRMRSEGCCACKEQQYGQYSKFNWIQPASSQQAMQTLVTMNFGDYSPCTMGLTIAASFINLRRSAVAVILGNKRVLLSHKIRGHTIFFVWPNATSRSLN